MKCIGVWSHPWDWMLFSPDTLPTETRFQHRRPPHQRHRPLSSLLWYAWRPICRGQNAWLHQCPAQGQDCPCRYTRYGRTISPRRLRSSGERRRTKVPQPWFPFLLVSGGIQRWPQARLGHTKLRREISGAVRGGDGDRHRRWRPARPGIVDLNLWVSALLRNAPSQVYSMFISRSKVLSIKSYQIMRHMDGTNWTSTGPWVSRNLWADLAALSDLSAIRFESSSPWGGEGGGRWRDTPNIFG